MIFSVEKKNGFGIPTPFEKSFLSQKERKNEKVVNIRNGSCVVVNFGDKTLKISKVG